MKPLEFENFSEPEDEETERPTDDCQEEPWAEEKPIEAVKPPDGHSVAVALVPSWLGARNRDRLKPKPS